MVNIAGKPKLKKLSAPTGFVYKRRSAESVKARAERKTSAFDSIFKSGFNSFRPKDGDNVVRILPPTWDAEDDHYGYQVWLHKRVGPDNNTYLCPFKMKQKKCPICNAAKEAQSSGETEEAKSLTAAENYVYWILDRADEDAGPQLYTVSQRADSDIAGFTHIKRQGKLPEILFIDDPDNGYDLSIRRSGQMLLTRYLFQVDRESSAIAEPKKQARIIQQIVDNPIPSTLKFFDADYLEKVISGVAEEKDAELEEEEDESENEAREARQHVKAKRAKVAEPEEDEEEDEGEEKAEIEEGEDEDEEDTEQDDEEDDEEDEDENGEEEQADDEAEADEETEDEESEEEEAPRPSLRREQLRARNGSEKSPTRKAFISKLRPKPRPGERRVRR